MSSKPFDGQLFVQSRGVGSTLVFLFYAFLIKQMHFLYFKKYNPHPNYNHIKMVFAILLLYG
ncbi:hypothetical protein, partial [Bacillus vallismortis]|uniref:hypothetical protein n=1 Tax=Bacillus vallismortis TaxID=72361 RepID=UPI0022816AF1